LQLKSGSRCRSAVSETEVVVVRAPERDIELTCGSEPMLDLDASPHVPNSQVGGSEVAIGKRYFDEYSGLEVLCTKAGAGPLACDGRQMVIKAPKPLPSSD
jgi:hypothetical protein